MLARAVEWVSSAAPVVVVVELSTGDQVGERVRQECDAQEHREERGKVAQGPPKVVLEDVFAELCEALAQLSESACE